MTWCHKDVRNSITHWSLQFPAIIVAIHDFSPSPLTTAFPKKSIFLSFHLKFSDFCHKWGLKTGHNSQRLKCVCRRRRREYVPSLLTSWMKWPCALYQNYFCSLLFLKSHPQLSLFSFLTGPETFTALKEKEEREESERNNKLEFFNYFQELILLF